LSKYIDEVSVAALSDSLNLNPENWQTEDLERILLIRDGLYDIRQNLRDSGDEAEHSVDQLLAGLDRLYADLERALRELGTTELITAKEQLATLQRGPHIETAVITHPSREPLTRDGLVRPIGAV
jgi:hypothetical protein